MLVALDHFGKVICGTGEWYTLLLEQTASLGNGIQRLLVKGKFAVQVVVNVGNIGGGVADDDLVLREGELGREGEGLHGA